jgi:hypothetical protein
LPWVAVSDDKTGFALRPSGKPFVPWGFNYDRDAAYRLIEDYWEAEWDKVAADFAEMKTLWANAVRVHLQLGKFMAAVEPVIPGGERRDGERLGPALGEKHNVQFVWLDRFRKHAARVVTTVRDPVNAADYNHPD